MSYLSRALLLALTLSTTAAAGAGGPTLPLWPGPPPGSRVDAAYQEEIIYRDNDPAKPRISRVITPTLEVFLPEKPGAARSAVVICPGGAYAVLAYDYEGVAVAQHLNRLGVAAFVLKYRLPHDAIMEDKAVGPLQDVQEAIRTVRRRAGDWGVDPARVGVLGFSAGGHLAGSATTLHGLTVYPPADATSARPDFSILIYPVLSMDPAITHAGSRENLLGKSPAAERQELFSIERQVGPGTPPTFLVHSLDDGAVPLANTLRYVEAAKAHGVSVEAHLYPSGGHGYGLAQDRGPQAPAAWPAALEAWLRSRQLL